MEKRCRFIWRPFSSLFPVAFGPLLAGVMSPDPLQVLVAAKSQPHIPFWPARGLPEALQLDASLGHATVHEFACRGDPITSLLLPTKAARPRYHKVPSSDGGQFASTKVNLGPTRQAGRLDKNGAYHGSTFE